MNREVRTDPRLVSVVVPYKDERRCGEYVDNWMAQTYPADKYEFVAVVNPSDRMVPELRARLRPHDQIVVSESREQTTMYAEGVAAAKGELLLLSEDHVVSETTCLERAVRGIVEGNLDGGSVAWGDINLTKTAAIEELACARDSVAWGLPGAWNTVRFRGFVIWRDVLESVGGFDVGYGLFAEASLAAKLHAAGSTIAKFGSEPMLSHVNTLSLSAVGRNTARYASQCRAFAAHNDPTYCERYFSVSQYSSRVTASPGTFRWRAAAAVARVRFELARSPSARLDAYTAYNAAQIELGWRVAPKDARFDFATVPSVSASARTDLVLERLHDVSSVEEFNGSSFRWSAPTFRHRLSFGAAGSYRMHLDTGSIRGHASAIPLTLTWNGKPIDEDRIRRDHRWIAAEIEVEAAGEGTFGVEVERLRVEPNTGEKRALGLPICAIWFEPVHSDASQSADSDSAIVANRSLAGT